MSQDTEDRGAEDGQDGNGEEQTTQQLMRRLITALEQKAGDGEIFYFHYYFRPFSTRAPSVIL